MIYFGIYIFGMILTYILGLWVQDMDNTERELDWSEKLAALVLALFWPAAWPCVLVYVYGDRLYRWVRK